MSWESMLAAVGAAAGVGSVIVVQWEPILAGLSFIVAVFALVVSKHSARAADRSAAAGERSAAEAKRSADIAQQALEHERRLATPSLKITLTVGTLAGGKWGHGADPAIMVTIANDGHRLVTPRAIGFNPPALGKHAYALLGGREHVSGPRLGEPIEPGQSMIIAFGLIDLPPSNELGAFYVQDAVGNLYHASGEVMARFAASRKQVELANKVGASPTSGST